MRGNQDWEDALTALDEVFHHEEGAVFDEWKRDEERFKADLMELIKAAYGGGYEDAIDDMESAGQKLVDNLDATLDIRYEGL